MAEIVDTMQVIYERMVGTDTDLFTLNGTRVYEDRLPGEEDEFDNTVSAIVINRTSELGQSSKEVREGTFAAVIYGGSDDQDDPKIIGRALSKRLDGISNSIEATGTIIYCEQLSAVPRTDPANGWPTERITFSFIIE